MNRATVAGELQKTIFGIMVKMEYEKLVVEQKTIASEFLKRKVRVDFYLPRNISDPSSLSLLLINDGQNLEEMNFSLMVNQLMESAQIHPLFCVGIHAGKDRRNEYGTSGTLDYEGRGTTAQSYQNFILTELLPFIHTHYCIESFRQKGLAGFSMGGLSALDLTWNHPEIFSIAGVFSGSLWWRTKTVEEDYNEDTDRIIHAAIRQGSYHAGLRFYFTTGSLDETADRNNNGIIDSIDDTLALIDELEKVGYDSEYDIKYINYEDGRHDIATWGRAMPGFLLWGWGRRR
ncbi:MAG: alpha/beta hydrolase [Flavisolibacter sp.]